MMLMLLFWNELFWLGFHRYLNYIENLDDWIYFIWMPTPNYHSTANCTVKGFLLYIEKFWYIALIEISFVVIALFEFIYIYIYIYIYICIYIVIFIDRERGHCWRSKDKLISDVLLWTPAYGRAKPGWPARTYIQQLCEDMGCSPEELPEAMNDWEKWREKVRDIRASSTT